MSSEQKRQKREKKVLTTTVKPKDKNFDPLTEQHHDPSFSGNPSPLDPVSRSHLALVVIRRVRPVSPLVRLRAPRHTPKPGPSADHSHTSGHLPPPVGNHGCHNQAPRGAARYRYCVAFPPLASHSIHVYFRTFLLLLRDELVRLTRINFCLHRGHRVSHLIRQGRSCKSPEQISFFSVLPSLPQHSPKIGTVVMARPSFSSHVAEPLTAGSAPPI